MQKRLLIPILIAAAIFTSCNKNNQKEALACDIYPVDFVDLIEMEGTVDAVKSITLTCPRRIQGDIVYLVEAGTHVNQGDTVCIIESKEMESDYEQTLLRVEDSKANLAKSEANLAMQYAQLRAEVESNATQTLIKQLDSLQLNYVSESQRKITELELKKTKIEREKLLKRLAALEEINKAELKKLKLSIKRDETNVQRTKEKLDKMKLVSPQSGLAVRARSWLTRNTLQEGDQVWGPMPILTIPDLSEMKVTLWASEMNYKRISVGNDVEMNFDAMPGNMAFGKITKKAPVGQPISRGSKVKIFEIEASVDSFNFIPEPGLSAQCKIFLQNIKDTIVVPQIAIFEEDTISVVYVKTAKSVERREVTIAEKSQKYAVVSEGLLGDECISLLRPNNYGKYEVKYLERNPDTITIDSLPVEQNTNLE